MAIILKSKNELDEIYKSAQLAARALDYAGSLVKPGISLLELDKKAEIFIRDHKATPSFKGYQGFPGTLCTSVNNKVVHSIPDNYVLQEGDIISVDVGAKLNGFHGDNCRCFPVGEIDKTAQKLITATHESVHLAIDAIKHDKPRLGDIGGAIVERATRDGFGVVEEYVGHGIGRDLHEDPQVLPIGSYGKGKRIPVGLVFTIEPILTEGSHLCKVMPDQWTVLSVDGKRSAQFEHMIAMTEEGPWILTELDGIYV